MNEQYIKDNAPRGATHYLDDDAGFDYVMISEDGFLGIWCNRFSSWLPFGYVVVDDGFKPL